MERIASAFMTLALVVGAIGAASAVGMAHTSTSTVQSDVDVHPLVTTTVEDETVTNDLEGSRNGSGDQANASEIAPGARFSGVVGAHEAKVEGEVETRAFGIKVSKARSDRAKAEIVSEQLGEIQQRLERLEKRRATMKQSVENGSATKAKFTAQIAELAVKTEVAAQLAQQTQETSSQLPADVLEENDIDASSIETLRDRAAGLKGDEVSQIAHQITPSHRGDADDGKDTDQGQGNNGQAGNEGSGSDNGNSGGDGEDADRGRGNDDGEDPDSPGKDNGQGNNPGNGNGNAGNNGNGQGQNGNNGNGNGGHVKKK